MFEQVETSSLRESIENKPRFPYMCIISKNVDVCGGSGKQKTSDLLHFQGHTELTTVSITIPEWPSPLPGALLLLSLSGYIRSPKLKCTIFGCSVRRVLCI